MPGKARIQVYKVNAQDVFLEYQSSFVPRAGEWLVLDADRYLVTRVEHNLSTRRLRARTTQLRTISVEVT
jgi:hypothetical protein